MASSLPSSSSSLPKADDEAASNQEIYDQLREVVSTYPAAPRLSGIGRPYVRHPDGWYAFTPGVLNAMVIKRHLEARDTDVLLATFPKSGTTWLKALLFVALHRNADGRDRLAAHSPHQLVPFLEAQVFTNGRIPDLSSLPAPRLLMTHVPSVSLPESVAASGCKVVYLCRDLKDCLVSLWYFWNGLAPAPWDLGEAFRQFCDGVSLFGPFWEHALGYWRWHLERPAQVLFLTYEELAADTLGQLRRLAGFVGRPFTAEEREAGVDRGIVDACAMESLAGLEVNRSGKADMAESSVPNSVFFRRGVVGDWKNHLTPEMARRLDEITESKFRGSGLVLPRATTHLKI
ncbi:Flavonol sulfotransferase-like protein [Triticum urartu]|uniref:Sulfotransferase n=2 Tax=Triticum urartu TaxID=4572 RepID=M7ZV01_TRIUA|nr:cytosolic sulfotransferase 5-like [Triticum urartu]XP_048575216.1 cytosolic sulfotransferase 5-like [Triticum urartu]XP_048575218.1 cytosolic sulfotransferase 5-like [Triticum urartu]EMS63466.1 Flavonol sulfotransferase-like protein [Triticum urartu]